MLRTGITIAQVKKNMNKYSWWKFSKEQPFESGEVNLHYVSGNEQLTLFFGKDGKLAKTART